LSKTIVGLLAGTTLGLLDGLSAWFSPEARTQMVTIVVASTLKGLATGTAAGFVARRWGSLSLAVAAGLAVGFVLSALAARSQPGHYWEIVLPGMLVGVLAGIIAQRYRVTESSGHSIMRSVGLVLTVAAASSALAASQSPEPVDLLARLTPLLGRWEGTSEGRPGKGTARRVYSRALKDRFIRVAHRVEYSPQDKNPKGELHEDEGFFGVDRARKRVVFRQFHVEGFVNTYVEDAESTPTRLVFITESIENIPPGWRARETYVVNGPDAFEEIFELAEAGKPFEVYSRTRFTRVQ
jgi:hypothetical protein